jgi:hypothetical protein
MFDNTPITAAELIEKLKQLPPDTKIIVPNSDSEYGGTHFEHVYDVSSTGYIFSGLCKEDWYEEDDYGYSDDVGDKTYLMLLDTEEESVKDAKEKE